MQTPKSKLQVLIQDRRSRLYLAGPGRWTHQVSEAVDFKLLESAHQFIHAEALPHVKVVPRFSTVTVAQAA